MLQILYKFLRGRILPALALTKNYARITGAILFVIGLLGFAFRSDNSLPDLYLVSALILGFWGIVSSLWDSGADTEDLTSSDRPVPSNETPPYSE